MKRAPILLLVVWLVAVMDTIYGGGVGPVGGGGGRPSFSEGGVRRRPQGGGKGDGQGGRLGGGGRRQGGGDGGGAAWAAGGGAAWGAGGGQRDRGQDGGPPRKIKTSGPRFPQVRERVRQRVQDRRRPSAPQRPLARPQGLRPRPAQSGGGRGGGGRGGGGGHQAPFMPHMSRGVMIQMTKDALANGNMPNHINNMVQDDCLNKRGQGVFNGQSRISWRDCSSEFVKDSRNLEMAMNVFMATGGD